MLKNTCSKTCVKLFFSCVNLAGLVTQKLWFLFRGVFVQKYLTQFFQALDTGVLHIFTSYLKVVYAHYSQALLLRLNI